MANSTVNRTRPPRSRRRAVAAVAAFLAGSLFAGSAEASRGYARTWVGAQAVRSAPGPSQARWGPAAEVGFATALGDFWSVAAGAQVGFFPALPASDLASSPLGAVWGGLRYNLDVFEYVPYLGLAVNTFLVRPQANGMLRGDITLKASVGVDWRFDRSWSTGARIDLHAPMTSPGDFPTFSSAGVDLAYHFRL